MCPISLSEDVRGQLSNKSPGNRDPLANHTQKQRSPVHQGEELGRRKPKGLVVEPSNVQMWPPRCPEAGMTCLNESFPTCNERLVVQRF